MKPILAITMGDPAGIGPEIIVKALNLPETYEKCRPLVTGDAAVMEWAVRQMGTRQRINVIHSVGEALFEPGVIDVYDLACVDMTTFEPVLYQAFAYGSIGFILSVKANGGAFKTPYFGSDGRGLGHCCIWTEVAVHDCKTGKIRKRLGHIRDYIFISLVGIVPFF